MRILLVAVLCLSGLFGSTAAAQPYPVPADPHVDDRAALLPDADARALRDKLTNLQAETGIQMLLLTLPSRRPYGPDQGLEAFATGLFNEWGIGDATENSGILLLILPEDRELRIELGGGYDPGYDAIAADIIERWILPEMRSGRPVPAITWGSDLIIERIAQRHHARLHPEALTGAPLGPRGRVDTLLGWFPWIIGGLVYWAVFGFRWPLRLWRWLRGNDRCPICDKRGLVSEDAPGVQMEKGLLIRTDIHCPHCRYQTRRERLVLPNLPTRRGSSDRGRDRDSGRSSSGGGGGSSGGGSSSGGGASGRW